MFSGTGWNHSCCHSSLEDSHEHPRVIFRHFCKFLSIQKKKSEQKQVHWNTPSSLLTHPATAECLLYRASLHLLLPPPCVLTEPSQFPPQRASAPRTGPDEPRLVLGTPLMRDHIKTFLPVAPQPAGDGECCLVATLWGYLSHTTSRPTSTPPVSLSSWVTAVLFHFLFPIFIPAFFSPVHPFSLCYPNNFFFKICLLTFSLSLPLSVVLTPPTSSLTYQ